MNEQMDAFLTDSTQRRADGTYTPPIQPNKSHKEEGNASQGVELSADYVGTSSRSQYTSQSKLQEEQRIDLNSTDISALQQVPGVGLSFIRRIARYRDQLGGYYTVLQLQEVFGTEPDRYRRIRSFSYIGVKNYNIAFQSLCSDNIPAHLYLNYHQ